MKLRWAPLPSSIRCTKQSSIIDSLFHFLAGDKPMRIPRAIERIVRRQNLKFLHNRNQFCPEYFAFIKKLVSSNVPQIKSLIENKAPIVSDLFSCILFRSTTPLPI